MLGEEALGGAIVPTMIALAVGMVIPAGELEKRRDTLFVGQRTVRVADPLIPPDFAAIVAVPALSPVASPLPLIEATGFGDDDQVTVLVRSLVLPLL